jgi:hypothetical protein
MISRLSRHAVALVALMCTGTAVHEAHSALLISGPAAGAPGDDLTFSVTLDAPLTGIDIDDLTLTLDFDSNVLSGHDATQGALVAGALFTPNSASGSAVASFLATQTGLGPGVLATWKFKIDPGAHLGSQTTITPSLRTTVIDNQPTGDLPGQPFTLSIVPEPSLSLLLIAGLALIASAQRVQRRR